MVDTSAVDTEIGARVHQAMWNARVTQVQLARALGLDQAAISRRLRGTTAWRVLDLFIAAKVLGVSPWDLADPTALDAMVMPATGTEGCTVRDSNPEPADSRKPAGHPSLLMIGRSRTPVTAAIGHTADPQGHPLESICHIPESLPA